LLGLPFADRYQVEGLQIRSAASSAALGNIGIGVIVGLTEEQLSSRAIARLATNPLPEVGLMQRRTTTWLVRPFPLGLRFSGKNMSPLPGWLAGTQSVCLNFSPIEGKSDLQVQLHFALFDGSGGYVLKPDEMKFREPSDLSGDDAGTAAPQGVFQKIQSQISNVSELSRTFSTLSDMRCTETDDVRGADRRDVRGADSEDVHGDISKDCFWPPPRKRLHRTTIEVISLHNLVTRREQRPRYNGIHQDCHDHVPQFSGQSIPPHDGDPSCPEITLSLYSIGGFFAMSSVLPIPQHRTETELTLPAATNGLNAYIGERIHCVAAEPHAVFLRIGVVDGRRELAFEVAVLGRLRRGYRVMCLRAPLGTRIELAYLFLRIDLACDVPNLWAPPRHVRIESMTAESETNERLTTEVRPNLDQVTLLTQMHEATQAEVQRLRDENLKLQRKMSRKGLAPSDDDDDSVKKEKD